MLFAVQAAHTHRKPQQSLRFRSNHFYLKSKHVYLQRVVFGDSLNHVWYGGLENLFKSKRVHHGKDSSKVLQDLFLLLHADSLTVGHTNVRLPVAGNLYLAKRGGRLCDKL